MRLIRAILGAIILFFDRAFRPKLTATRSPEAQAKVEAETRSLSLYHFEACPFCVKVRRHLTARALPIELRDVKRNKGYEKELVSQGGQFQVPCLRIDQGGGKVEWMYESSDIMAYLDRRFP